MKELEKEAFTFITEEAMVITRRGVKLRKEGDRLQVRDRERVLGEHPFYKIKSLTVSTGVGLTSDFLKAAGEAELEVLFVDGVGRPFGSFISVNHLRTARLRREQCHAAADHRGAYLARTFALAKLNNQCRLLQYFTRNEKDPEVDRLVGQIRENADRLAKVEGPSLAAIAAQVMGFEGTGARLYWAGVMRLLAGKAEFAGRETRGAADPVNSCLNYGYAILYGECWRALLRKGFDPFAGFLHRDRDGSTTLVFDFAEEFRQPLVDRAVIATFRRGWQPKFQEDGKLDLPSRKHILELVKENLDRDNYAVTLLVDRQAASLAAYLLDGQVYQPLTERWW